MSYIRLNITDQMQTISGEVHGSAGDAVIAALAAEPETVEELALALARFVHSQDDASPFASFHTGENFEPYDAGIVIIDLAARVVAADSSYSQPSANGEIAIHDGKQLTGVRVPYRLAEGWLFVGSIPEYEGVRKQRDEERERVQPLDAREVLYGKALLEFIAQECLAARDANDEDLFTNLHAKWLMTAREDLQGKTPREVLLARHDFIDFDLRSRELQWSFTGKCPPPLPTNSNAYLHAGFGTHEIVVYYDLIRHLLGECFERLRTQEEISTKATIEFLEQTKAFWLETPNRDYSGIVPSRYIELERRRIPFVISAQEAIIDEGCSVCQMMAEDLETPMFRHLDGSHMDDLFEFSFYHTREEWQAEQERREEFNREFEREWQERKEKNLQNELLSWLNDDEGLVQ